MQEKGTYLLSVEQAIAELQMKRNDKKNLITIKKMLNAQFREINCEDVSIVPNEHKSHFFGICVFPTLPELDSLANKISLFTKKTPVNSPKNYVIEIDSKLLYRLGASAEEITAGIVHEIGHRLYSDQELVDLKLRLINSLVRYIGFLSSLLLFNVLKILVRNIIILAFTSTIDELIKLRGEMRSDTLAAKLGYGEPLMSLLDKMIDASKFYITTPSDTKKMLIQWTLKNAINFRLRKNEIKRFLKSQLQEERSPTVRAVLKQQLADLEKIKGVPTKDAIENGPVDDMVQESLSTFFELRRKGYSDLEIDEIRVEIDDVEVSEDKLYVISRIYKNLELANKMVAKLNSTKLADKSKIEAIENFKSQLYELLKKARDTKVKKSHDFSVIIKNPQGDYEGLDYVKF